MVCTANATIFNSCDNILRERGYKLKVINNLDKAFKELSRNFYQIIILDQQFLNSGETGRRVFAELKSVPSQIRRLQTIALLTPNIASGESQVFYQWGIDLNIHPKDLDRIDSLLEQVLETKRQLLTPLLQYLSA